MTVCIVLGRKNRQAAKRLCRCLERYGGALLLCEEAVEEFYVYQPEYVVYAPRRCAVLPSADALLIRWSEDEVLLTFGGGKIRIGLGESCDITASSIGTGKLSVGIQNVIPTCSGKELLPCDFPVEYREAPSIQTLLCACAVLLVTENLRASEDSFSF